MDRDINIFVLTSLVVVREKEKKSREGQSTLPKRRMGHPVGQDKILWHWDIGFTELQTPLSFTRHNINIY